MKNPIIMHINYCEQGQTLPEVFEVASRIGYDGIEFRRSGDNYHLPLESYLETIAALREQYHMPYILFGGPALDAMTSQRDTLQKNTEEYLHFLEVADRLGLLSTVNFMCGSIANPKVPMDLYHCESHGFAVHEPWQWEQAVTVCRIVADAKPQVKFAFETHMFFLHDTAKTTRALVEAIDRPNFGINLDYGNALFFPHTEPLAKAIEIAGDKLFYTHFKSYQPVGSGAGQLLPTSLADGCINHREYLRCLQALSFEGPIGIEAPRPGDREHFASEDYAYIQPLIRNA